MSPAQRELWDYVVQLVACEKKSQRRQQAIRQKRQVCATVLCDPMRDDEEALIAVKMLLV